MSSLTTSNSKSPVGSPTSDGAPKPKETRPQQSRYLTRSTINLKLQTETLSMSNSRRMNGVSLDASTMGLVSTSFCVYPSMPPQVYVRLQGMMRPQKVL